MLSIFKFMTIKPNVSKIGGLFLAVIVVAVFYFMFTTKTNVNNVEYLPSINTDEVASANGITMKLISAHTEASGYRVEVCYDLPDERDWLLTYPSETLDTTLSVADIKATPVEEGTMYWRYGQNGELNQRCQFMFFSLSIPSYAEEMSLRIERLYARESGQLDNCLEVSQKMVERNYSVTIDCIAVTGFDDLVTVRFPTELLSMDPVFKNIFKDVKWDFYDGPWSFTFPVNSP